ncbi:MAG: ABC-type transport auxiliary lipoprotein family protein [Candidatus Thiothrix sulfatifontis]|nr:MAG: ABC-type transport auxiliary lipoprotein family protein [Candidatus Thiothrix sulfatifontis]
MNHWVFVLLLVLLSACSVPLKSDLPVEQTYRLAPSVATASQRLAVNLYVPKVMVSPALDSERIVLIKSPLQQDFIAQSRWPDDLSVYLHAVILDALARSDGFQAVSEQMLGQEGNYKLLLRVADFQAEYPKDAKDDAAVEVVMDASLVRVTDQHLLGQHRYAVRKDAVPVSTGKIVEALNQALGEVIAALVADLQKDL